MVYVRLFKVKYLWPFKYKRRGQKSHIQQESDLKRSDDSFFGSKENDPSHETQASVWQNFWEMHQVSFY